MDYETPMTNVTKVIHWTGYPAIAPTRPKLSQAGRTVLVVGGGTSIGKSIAENFARAKAATVIIIGRRENVLQEAVADLEAIARSGTPETWHHFESNVKAPLHMAELFSKQPGNKPRFLQFISSAAVNMSSDPVVAVRPSYTLTKLAATYAFSLISDNFKSDKKLVLSFHPGMLYNDNWTLFSVWAASSEAHFLHGRFVYAAWDVIELAGPEFAKKFAADPDFLRPGIIGLTNAGRLA